MITVEAMMITRIMPMMMVISKQLGPPPTTNSAAEFTFVFLQQLLSMVVWGRNLGLNVMWYRDHNIALHKLSVICNVLKQSWICWTFFAPSWINIFVVDHLRNAFGNNIILAFHIYKLSLMCWNTAVFVEHICTHAMCWCTVYLLNNIASLHCAVDFCTVL